MTDEKDQEMSPDEKEPKGSESGDDSSSENASADPPEGDPPEGEAANATPDSDSDDQASEAGEAAAEGDPASKAVDSSSADQAVAVEGDENKVVNSDDASEDDAEEAMMGMLEDLPDEGSAATAEDINFGTPKVSEAEFQQLSEPAGTNDKANIDMLMDIDLPVAIELGRTEMSIHDILALGPGSVVELSKLAGEPVDLLVNSKVVARGEVVVVDENFGLRVTHLLTPEERLRCLAEA